MFARIVFQLNIKSLLSFTDCLKSSFAKKMLRFAILLRILNIKLNRFPQVGEEGGGAAFKVQSLTIWKKNIIITTKNSQRWDKQLKPFQIPTQ